MSDGLIIPGRHNRTTIIGKNGSGKTFAGTYWLSRQPFDKMPFVIFNWKRDDLLDAIPGTIPMAVTAKPPKKPGLYMVHPTPVKDDDAVEDLLWAIWEKERTGLYFDEGYMIPARSAAYQALLTQGRSKIIPTITLTQRPAWLSRFAFSEADYIQLFQLSDMRDIKSVMQFMPMDISKPLEPFHSYWWDNKRNFRAVLQPVPDRDNILESIRLRLHKPRRIF